MSTKKWSEIRKERYVHKIYEILAYQPNNKPLIEIAGEIFNYMDNAQKESILGRSKIEEAVWNETKSKKAL